MGPRLATGITLLIQTRNVDREEALGEGLVQGRSKTRQELTGK